MELARTGKGALEDILPVLCPAAMNHPTTLRIMERFIADEFRYEVSTGGPLPLGVAPALRSILWKRSVGRRSVDGPDSQARKCLPRSLILPLMGALLCCIAPVVTRGC